MRRIAIAVVLAVAALLAVGTWAWADTARAPLSTNALKAAVSAGDRNTLVFFENPAGGPCRAQNEVLRKLQQDRKGSFNVVSVSVTRPEDRQAFYDYGIRNLPSLVLVDRAGRIARVFPPGIQSYETLATALDRSK
jgi:thioredoxin-like negative regulator of GroEL